MYTNDKMVLQLLSLLKQNGIRRIVVSPGSRHYAFVHSLEQDDYFKLYSVVDERSAAFFALGLIQQTKEIVAVACSSGTACMNYGSAIVEAYYQKLPLLVLSSDRIPSRLNQMEDQMYNQYDAFKECTKYRVQLPVVKDKEDEWLCNRLINEAILELTNHGKGPVHINIPFKAHHSSDFVTEVLPTVRKISLHTALRNNINWSEIQELLRGKKVMILWGQSVEINEELQSAVDVFCEKFGAIILTDKFSNCHCKNAISNTTVVLSILRKEERVNLQPDVVISIGGNYLFNPDIKTFLYGGGSVNWIVNEEGKVCDPFHTLTDIYEMSENVFFTQMTNNLHFANETAYFDAWLDLSQLPTLPTTDYNELFAIGELLRNLPEGVDLQLANSCTIRISHFFPTDKNVRVNCNRGVNGIDGSLSTAVGFSADNERPTFYITGDLSFFYDMNALGITCISPKMRIMLINNNGGAVMYAPSSDDLTNGAPIHLAAYHNHTAKGWVESLGFKYVEAHNAVEVKRGVEKLCNLDENRPVFMEVFTTFNTDTESIANYYSSQTRRTYMESIIVNVLNSLPGGQTLKSVVKKMLK